jgi:hypothetical protein
MCNITTLVFPSGESLGVSDAFVRECRVLTSMLESEDTQVEIPVPGLEYTRHAASLRFLDTLDRRQARSDGYTVGLARVPTSGDSSSESLLTLLTVADYLHHTKALHICASILARRLSGAVCPRDMASVLRRDTDTYTDKNCSWVVSPHCLYTLSSL